MVILPLPQHLPLKVNQLLLPRSQKDPHQFVRDSHVMLKEFPKFDSDHFSSIFLSEFSDVYHHLTQLLNLSADVCVSILAPLLCHGALQGPPILILPSLGDLHTDSGVLTEGVVLLIFAVCAGPLLPVLLHAFYRNNAHCSVLTELRRRWSLVFSFHDGGALAVCQNCCLWRKRLNTDTYIYNTKL